MTTALERSRALPPDPNMPTLQEELDRKALDTLEQLLRKYDDGLLSQRELKAATWALFEAVSGLVDRGIIDIISQVAELPSEGNPVIARKFVHGDKLALIERSLVDATVTLQGFEKSPASHFTYKQRSFAGDMRPFQLAAQYEQGIVEKLIERGYEEV